MSDKERFEAFKQSMVEENEKQYGAEMRQKYGEEAVLAPNRRMLQMTEQEYERFRELEGEILAKLEDAVREGKTADSDELKEVVALHKEWLLMTWDQYTPDAHIGLGKMYAADERFKKYYDRNVAGCAALLCEAIEKNCKVE